MDRCLSYSQIGIGTKVGEPGGDSSVHLTSSRHPFLFPFLFLFPFDMDARHEATFC